MVANALKRFESVIYFEGWRSLMNMFRQTPEMIVVRAGAQTGAVELQFV